ncbi:MAG TPA: methyltransferase domain-containing protein [Tepidisphaeraceae bacterium]|nr:methyltransferase domain-containing protein [Tepidisphaeraceae bacterium]
MVPEIIDFARRTKEAFGVVSGRVLEVGSCDINGTVRPVFSDASEYIGVDASEGAGVDRVLDAHDILATFGPESFHTVICCEMLEHDSQPWVSVPQLHAVLKPGGHLLVTTPTFGFPLHRHPRDYWRFGEDAYREFIFAGLDVLELTEVRDTKDKPILCCLGRKPLCDLSELEQPVISARMISE